jgi:xylose isomerase
VRANFEFINKLGVDFWCFHDRDIAPDAPTLEVSQSSKLSALLNQLIAILKEDQSMSEMQCMCLLIFNI